jgi:Ca2+-binding EF-hand superfamily protein
MDEKPITCSTLMEVIPSVQKMLAQAKDTCKLFEEQEVRPSFFKYDADGSGTIDRGELKTCLAELGYSNMSDEELEAAFQSLDANGDGSIDYNEFRTWFLSG